MLSRTASELFWMARYLERAESYARVLDVTWKLSMIPRHSQQSRDLALPLNLSMTHELFQARHARFTMSNLLNFLPLMATTPAVFTAAWRWRGTMRTPCAAVCRPKCGRASMPPALSCEACASRGWASWGATAFLSG